MYDYARQNNNFYVNDINYIAAEYGLSKWHDLRQWHMYKYAMDINAVPVLCRNIANIIKATLGKNKKVIVLDLDNTLWGGVIGDDGPENIEIGNETPKGEAYTAFQQYLVNLKNRGVILAVCSKNDPEIAKKAFKNQRMVLKFEDFIIFKANWDDKASNIIEISRELNIPADNFIFIDDNPAEREIVSKNIPGITVNDENDVETFIEFIDKNGFFEAVSVTGEDLKRIDYYKENITRATEALKFEDYSKYLDSLEMVYTFDTFNKNNLERVLQLINKTNQFNLTTKRMTDSEIRTLIDDNHLNITVELRDKFGDNGLISVFSGTIYNSPDNLYNVLDIDLWLMSCRVFKRNVEYKLFEHVLKICMEKDISEIKGHYVPTEKNGIVREFYKELGFTGNEENIWVYQLRRKLPYLRPQRAETSL